VKIAMVCADGLPPGGRARREARVLVKEGHLVTVYGVLAEGAEPEEDEQNVVLVRAPLGRFARPKDGLRGALSAAAYFERCRPVVDLAMTRDPPEALHAFGLDVALPAFEAARDAAIPLVLDEASAGDETGADADDGSRGGGARLREALQRLRVRGAAVERTVRGGAVAGIVTSDALADDVEERFGGPRPVVLRECPPLRRLRAGDALRVKLGIHPADRVVVFHGPPDRAHGVEAAIRAVRVLGERVVLVVLGAAWCQDRLLRLAAEVGVLPQVRVTSFDAAAGALPLLASAEVAVLPLSSADRRTRLGVPAALLDCVMAGLPLVVPDVAGAGGLVRRLGLGLVVPAADDVAPNDVADAVRTLIADP
jgi:glycosyltransferase involved in cell wall biosynthesis